MIILYNSIVYYIIIVGIIMLYDYFNVYEVNNLFYYFKTLQIFLSL